MTTNPNEVTDAEVEAACIVVIGNATAVTREYMRRALEQFAQSRTSATSDAADAVQWEHVGTVARTVMRIDVGWLKDLPAGTYLYAAIALPVQPADDIHPCSFFCNLPGCIKTQRDLLRDQLCKKATP